MQQKQPEHQDIREVAPDTFVNETGHQLTKKEVREIVTPHAFVVSDELIGQPLAKPLRRGLAIGIDGVIISGLASASLIFVLPTMLYLCWNRYKAQKTNHLLLMVLATLCMLLTLNWAPQLLQEKETASASDLNLTPHAGAELAKVSIELSTKACDDRCVEDNIKSLALELQQSGVSAEHQRDLLDGVLDITQLKGAEKRALLDKYVAEPQVVAEPVTTAPVTKPAKEESYSLMDKLKNSDYSLIKWVKGILADFGLGFGWAMVYFTFYTSWNNGQTIGKRLTRIRVVQLDNQPLSLWASFSRQGGYGAGFATGLVGFAQILWDPNRQAIQDKVASTVVLYKP
ncbi:RDD family protein [Rheinheimera soli]|uniref:RDD family membrane protein YckC n=1 Tax=Rheinheimera soli TaxID=443616 RepID=A0ABU1W0L0_9GAMM|nr:RDD family protein [Rheinheimera soli]MDR7121457.1 putative RDD family membrane protein YckC [Rheinheimera soli]